MPNIKRPRINPMSKSVCSSCQKECLSIPETKHRKCRADKKGTWVKK